jgi:hypothetical protein
MAVKLVFLRTGFTLSLCAWVFGALLLGAGNAYFGVTGGQAPTAHTANMHSDAGAYAHESGTGPADHLAHEGHGSHSNLKTIRNVDHGSHSPFGQPLPAHCLFCIDGLAATVALLALLLVQLTNSPALPVFALPQRLVVANFWPRPHPRGPPAPSPAH